MKKLVEFVKGLRRRMFEVEVEAIEYLMRSTEKFKDRIKTKTANEGEIITSSGAENTTIFIILKGHALVEIQNSLAKNNFYALLSSNHMFGISLFSDHLDMPTVMAYSITARTKIHYLEVDRQFFIDHMYITPEFYFSVLTDLSRQYSFLARAFQMKNEPLVVRILNTLLEISKILDIKESKKGELVFPKYVNQGFIADYANASPAKTSQVLRRLEKEKIIRRKPITIINMATYYKVMENKPL